ncbi:uncharacterized protein I303_105345 [Kwoniella dejecticola CBS 10117]|uniref:Helicase C-terminal domain-containing protein n=1 Tax=Kwoniella dejecticola CBS 10117 TaxID=1296121 RepID=A0AAJ8KRZ8_9TREE
MAPVKTIRNILMELRKICQHPYISQPELESLEIPEEEQHQQLIEASGKLRFLKLLLPKLKERGHRVLLFSQFKIALDRIEDFLYGQNVKFLRLDGDVQQAQRQKSMDLFNAPNSEYDVFLLTTRAGGVGINLATADTVILYDPDFNPHQDLQAIARSHRYGQKKKVLVFKLMVKGSVEENIINKGKKKMVLDHLVVQQMGKESEEGDIDDLLLRGAEAVYSNHGGINIPDIVYNSKNVDELIDKVEADAEAEAKELEEREKNAQEGSTDNARSRATQQFGFAKIWEADQNQLMNIAEENEEDDEGRRATNWESILEAMEKDRQDKLNEMLTLSQPKRVRHTLNRHKGFAPSIAALEAEANSPKKKSHKSKKGKGKAMLQGSSVSGSDYEFDATLLPEDDEFDDFPDSNMPNELFGLDFPDVKMTKRELKKLRKTQVEQQIAGNLPTVAGPSTQSLPEPLPGPSNHIPYIVPDPDSTIHTRQPLQEVYVHPLDQALPGPSSHAMTPASGNSSAQGISGSDRKRGRPKISKEDKLAKKRQRLEEKAKAAASAQAISQSVPNGNPDSYPRPAPSQLPLQSQHLGQDFTEARRILQLLYSILKEFGNDKSIRRWGFVALRELSPEERADRYRVLAEETDNHLAALGQPRYFSLPEQARVVLPLFWARGDVIMDETFVPPPIPPGIGILSHPPINIAAPGPANPAPKIRKRINLSGDTINTNGHTPPSQVHHHISGPSTMAGLSRNDELAPSIPGPYNPYGPTNNLSIPGPYAPNGSSHSPHLPHSIPGPSTIAGLAVRRDSNKSTRSLHPSNSSEALFNSLMDSAPPACQFCRQPHALKDCHNLSSSEDLQGIKKAILEGNEPEYDKMIALKHIERTQQWLIKAGKLSNGEPSNGLKKNTLLTPANSIALSNSTNGTSNTPIENGHPSASASASNSTSGMTANGKLKGKGKSVDQPVQGSPTKPIEILDSPAASPRAAHSSESDEPSSADLIDWSSADHPSSKSPSGTRCAFCEKNCDRPLRVCIDAHGGRKALKNKIRHCEDRIQESKGSTRANMTNMQSRLYDMYKQWPRNK